MVKLEPGAWPELRGGAGEGQGEQGEVGAWGKARDKARGG